MNLYAKGLNIVSTVSTAGEVGKVKLDLVPALVKSHGHGANKWFDTGCGLVIRSAESSAHVLVV